MRASRSLHRRPPGLGFPDSRGTTAAATALVRAPHTGIGPARLHRRMPTVEPAVETRARPHTPVDIVMVDEVARACAGAEAPTRPDDAAISRRSRGGPGIESGGRQAKRIKKNLDTRAHRRGSAATRRPRARQSIGTGAAKRTPSQRRRRDASLREPSSRPSGKPIASDVRARVAAGVDRAAAARRRDPTRVVAHHHCRACGRMSYPSHTLAATPVRFARVRRPRRPKNAAENNGLRAANTVYNTEFRISHGETDSKTNARIRCRRAEMQAEDEGWISDSGSKASWVATVALKSHLFFSTIDSFLSRR